MEKMPLECSHIVFTRTRTTDPMDVSVEVLLGAGTEHVCIRVQYTLTPDTTFIHLNDIDLQAHHPLVGHFFGSPGDALEVTTPLFRCGRLLEVVMLKETSTGTESWGRIQIDVRGRTVVGADPSTRIVWSVRFGFIAGTRDFLGAAAPTDPSRLARAVRRELSSLSQARTAEAQLSDGGVVGDLVSPVPPLANRMRIMGSLAGHQSDQQFIDSGLALARSFVSLYERYAGLKLDEQSKVLDWGVGCGRVSRHIAQLGCSVTGWDVDPVNVEWCQKNLPSASFERVDPHEVTRKDLGFDLVYSWSVMTHLSPADQVHWLQTLSSVCSGLMILSIHDTCHSASYDWMSDASELLRFLELGHRDAGQNPDIADVTPPGYYADVANTHTFIRQTWSAHVEVLDILPKALGGHAAVICRSRSASLSSPASERDTEH